jgi:hypothetical protein
MLLLHGNDDYAFIFRNLIVMLPTQSGNRGVTKLALLERNPDAAAAALHLE